MLIVMDQILGSEDLERARSEVETLSFVDGKATAGALAKSVKNNQQAKGGAADGKYICHKAGSGR